MVGVRTGTIARRSGGRVRMEGFGSVLEVGDLGADFTERIVRTDIERARQSEEIVRYGSEFSRRPY